MDDRETQRLRRAAARVIACDAGYAAAIAAARAHGMTWSDIAHALGTTPGAARMRHERATRNTGGGHIMTTHAELDAQA